MDNSQCRKAARRLHEHEGKTLVKDTSRTQFGGAGGVWVEAWVWVPWTEVEAERHARCDSCGLECPQHRLAKPKDLALRLDPNGVVPAGECPECGALAYLIE